MKQKILLLPLLTLAAAGCATAPSVPPETGQRKFVVERDLVGERVACGEFRTITGVRRGFKALLNGSWDGDTLTLVEDFEFDDGEQDRKTWTLEQISPGLFSGTREDVIGTAKGFQDGNVFRLEYDIVLASDDSNGRKVRFRDVLALDSDNSIINTATIGWWGVKVGSVYLKIQSPADHDGAECKPA